MLRIYKSKSKRSTLFLVSFLFGLALTFAGVSAQPFGVGVFNANVPFGGETSLTIATDGNINIPISPASSASATSTVTVTSSDVVGYKLYVRALSSTNLSGTGGNIPASSNVSPGALVANTWGYNTDNSTDYVGITASDVLLKNATGPYTSGDITQVYYGVKVDFETNPGTYSCTVIYTAVPQTT